MELGKKLTGGMLKDLPKNHSILDLFKNTEDTLEFINIENLGNLKLDFLAQNGMAGPGKKNLFLYEFVENFSKQNNIPLLVRELPVIRTNTNGWWRFSWGSFFCDRGLYPYDEEYNRWNEISQKCDLTIKKWNRPGSSILICLQKSRDSALNKLHANNYEYYQYCVDLINDVKLHTDRPIIVRAHPRDILLAKNLQEKFFDIEFSMSNSLEFDFNRAWCCITYNSNSAVEAVLHGLPSITLDTSSPAYDVSHHFIKNIEDDVSFDLDSWLKKIAFMQWSPDEILSGKAWYYIKKII